MGMLLLCCAAMLGYFSYRRFVEYRRDKKNTVNYHYWLAALALSFGFAFYSIPSVFWGSNSALLVAGVIVATILNAIGFGHFLLIPLYTRFSYKNFVISKYLLYLSITIIAGLLIMMPPASYLDASHVIHWQFSRIESWFMLLFICTAFTLNLLLLGHHVKKLITFSFTNTMALIFTFLTTGIGGGYMYIGNNSILLVLATVFLYIGISIIFVASLQTAIRLKKAANVESE